MPIAATSAPRSERSICVDHEKRIAVLEDTIPQLPPLYEELGRIRASHESMAESMGALARDGEINRRQLQAIGSRVGIQEANLQELQRAGHSSASKAVPIEPDRWDEATESLMLRVKGKRQWRSHERAKYTWAAAASGIAVAAIEILPRLIEAIGKLGH